MTDELYLGVDGGKSKTVCLVATRDGTIVGFGRAGNADHSTIALSSALDAVASAVAAALHGAGRSREPVAIGCFGMAGAVWPEDVSLLEDGLRARGLARQVIVRNDAQVALRAASTSGQGIVLSAGTHLSVALRTTGGEEWFSGWSSVDGPGGAEVGRRVVWAVIHAYDGRGPRTALTDEVLLVTGLGAEGLLRMIAMGELGESFTASLAPILFRVHARTQDAVAGSIIDGVGREMATWIPGLRTRFPSDHGVDVYLGGGLFRAPDPRLEVVVRSCILSETPDARIHRLAREPVIGAVLGSMDHAGVTVSDPLLDRIDATGPPRDLFATDRTEVHPPGG